jgi:hypothetical protein
VRWLGFVTTTSALDAVMTGQTDWSCTCDDDCPSCGARHMSPVESDDLTRIIERRRGMFVVWRSTPSAEHSPDYREVIEFPTFEQAATFLGSV